MKQRSPQECKNEDQVCQLQTDHKDLKNFWIMYDGWTVSIHKQKAGEAIEQEVSIPKRTFDKLIEWYQKPQPITPPPTQPEGEGK